MKRLRSLLPFVIVFLAIACAKQPPTVPTPQPVLRDSSDAARFVVGTAIADITPPLHLSLFGHGPESRVATGVRLRLRCQVFLVAAGGSMLALIPCDLQSSSAALHRGIADRLRSFGIPLTADRIYVMANHTHAGPAHYFEARRYSGTFSSSIPGYDKDVVEFLVQNISEAVVRAYAAPKPACIGWTEKELPGLTFNRAYVPFLANKPTQYIQGMLIDAAKADQNFTQSAPSAPSGREDEAQAPKDWLYGAEKAVDHRLLVMRIDSRDPGRAECEAKGPPLGVLAVYGMHPAGVPNTNELYHGDIFGFATRTAAACLSHAKPPEKRAADSSVLTFDETGTDCDDDGKSADGVPVGLANGVEGDVSPKLPFQSVPNARRLGRQLGLEIARTAAGISTTAATGPVRRAYWELSFPGAWADSKHTRRLCGMGELGMAVAGGVHDGPTRLRVIPEANAGYRLDQDEAKDLCQGRKLPARLGFGPGCHDYPRFGAISLLEVGDARFATVPAEPTTATGARIREALQEWSGKNPLAVVGLTNHYLQYVATREEYDFQYYEGASTLYGPHSSEFLVRSFGCLAKWMDGKGFAGCEGPRKINQPGKFEPSPAPEVTRFPQPEKLEPLILANVQIYRSWPDGDRGWHMTFPRMPLDFTADREKFRVEVLAGRSGETIVDDDRGSAIEVREVDQGDSWRVRWTPDLKDRTKPPCGGVFRLAVRGRFHVTSVPFTATCDAKRGEP